MNDRNEKIDDRRDRHYSSNTWPEHSRENNLDTKGSVKKIVKPNYLPPILSVSLTFVHYKNTVVFF